MNKIVHAFAVLQVYRAPWLRFMDHFRLLTPQPYTVYLRNGLNLLARGLSSDFLIVDEVYIHGVYDRALSRIRPGMTVVDIGAQMGVFTLAAAKRGASVICFEPFPENFSFLESNLSRNICGARVKALNIAVAGSSGELVLYYASGDTGGATAFPSMHPSWSKQAALRNRIMQRKVEATTLHELLRYHGITHCDCLKLDCEGMEYEIIESA